ncbi:MAG: sigma-70 family RNA polymerase sigma factor [Verrucomicrobia bacterium]|nr:sigma-70 family RNA polymerase sigma factor [Verrucomicrobiota bacterium]
MEAVADIVEPQASKTEPVNWQSPEFGAIYEEHSKPIFYLTLRMLGEPSAAEDATHDIFIKAFRGMKDFRGQANIRTWLYRIAINHCRNLQQSWHGRHIFSNADEAIWETTSHNDHPLRVLETKELGQRIQTALDALPDEYRLLLLLVADEKMSYEEMGELTGQTGDAVRGKLHRARKAFQNHFQKTA